MKAEGRLVCFYPKVGRGSVVILDVGSNDELHAILTDWMNIVPGDFQIYPLASPAAADDLLK